MAADPESQISKPNSEISNPRSEIPKPKPRRRWFQFSLRGLLMLMLVFGCGLGWLANWAHRQHRAVAMIHERGGRIVYDYQFSPDGVHNFEATLPCPQWIERIVGIDFYANVSEVCLEGTEVTDRDLARLSVLSSLRVLGLGPDCSITNEGLRHIRHLSRIERLYLSHAQIDDSGLAHLPVESLQDVCLIGLPIFGKGLANMQGCGSLWRLDLNGSQINDEGLSHLPVLPSLGYLTLTRTKITSAGLKHLAKQPNLSYLNISETAVDDDALRILATFPALTMLEINGTRITEAGVGRIPSILNVGFLNVGDLGLSPEAVIRLREGLPACCIHDDSGEGFSVEDRRAEGTWPP